MASKLMAMAVLGIFALATMSMLALPALAAGVGTENGDCDQTMQKDMLKDGSCDDGCDGTPDQDRDRLQTKGGLCDGAMKSYCNNHCNEVGLSD